MNMRTAAIFTSGMILQNGTKAPVWGWAGSGDRVTVEFAGQKKTARANKDGRWSVWLNPLTVSAKSGTMTIGSAREKRRLTLANILVGEVWLCSGQSNMQCAVADSLNPEEEILAANYPNIRLFTVPCTADVNPGPDIAGAWKCCSPETVGAFSAVAYFFGREIHRKTGVPVGLINASWGGTYAEAWASRKAMSADPFYRKVLAEYQDEKETPDGAAAKLEEWARKYDFKDTKNEGLAKGWHKPDANVAKWKRIDLPRTWQSFGHAHSGVFWFRRKVALPAGWKGKDIKLSLGATDKSDITYFNGVKIGSITMEVYPNAWCTPRVYTVPGKFVKAGGVNVIAVRVFSNTGQGGFTGAPAQMKLVPVGLEETEAIPLAGIWNYELEADFGLIPPPPPPPTVRGQGNRNSPHILFDNMIRPLIPYAIRGAIWYQGESNANNARQYQKLFPLLIKGWRNAWQQGNFHFIFVQLANYGQFVVRPAESAWAELREAQAMTLSLPNTSMAVAIDLGEFNNIHPKNKQDVGLRLARPALAKLHGFKKLVYSGPIFKAMRTAKNRIHIEFNHVAGGLVFHGAKLKGFSIAGKDKKFEWANAVIEGDGVVVASPKVPKPVAVRYGWADNPACNLYNSSDLPASPFRTDDWPGAMAHEA